MGAVVGVVFLFIGMSYMSSLQDTGTANTSGGTLSFIGSFTGLYIFIVVAALLIGIAVVANTFKR